MLKQLTHKIISNSFIDPFLRNFIGLQFNDLRFVFPICHAEKLFLRFLVSNWWLTTFWRFVG